jgi:carbohydrate-selective porin OprB
MLVFLRGITSAAVLMTVLFSSQRIGFAQEPTPTPTPSPGASTPKNPSPVGQEVASATATKPAAPEPDFWTQETMTGDWGGTRSRWKEKGVELEFEYVGIVQGIASGGTNDQTTFTNKLETKWKFDLGKVAGWKFWSSEIKAEWRFGGPAITGTALVTLPA